MKAPLNLREIKREATRNTSEVNFGYKAKSEEYANLSSDISELAEIRGLAYE